MESERQWTLCVRWKDEAQETALGAERELLRASEKGRWVVRLLQEAGRIRFEVRTYAKDQPLVLSADLEKGSLEAELVWLGYRLELWIDGRLRDEEWPMGESFQTMLPQLRFEEALLQAEWRPEAKKREFLPRAIEDISCWAPELGAENVGDCMPFADGDTYHLFYLKDRHGHRSKWGKGAHQFAHLTTKDLVKWQEQPMAVEITHPWEGSICTGSLLKAKGRYYAFYAVRMMDETEALISWATSRDCIHFEKSERYFALHAPYEPTSARDPEVFWGEDGRYHMLVTTNLEGTKVPERSGCLAHLVSDDLEIWEQQEPFLVPGYTDQPECSDYFAWNGWYYLIFSNYGTAKYRYSRQPFGPWICPENEKIDGLLYRVPKTACLRGRRIAAGFLPCHPEGDSYAGSLVLRELKQREDGTLTTCFVRELLPEQKGQQEELVLACDERNRYCQAPFSATGAYRRIQLSRRGGAGSFGLTMNAGGRKGYELRFDPLLKTVGIYSAHSNLYYAPSKRVLENVDGLDGQIAVELLWKKGILDLCINRERTLVCRLSEDWADAPEIELGAFVKDCEAMFRVCW